MIGGVVISRAAKALAFSGEDRGALETWVNAHNPSHKNALWTQLILCASDGIANTVIDDELGITRSTVLKRRKPFCRSTQF